MKRKNAQDFKDIVRLVKAAIKRNGFVNVFYKQNYGFICRAHLSELTLDGLDDESLNLVCKYTKETKPQDIFDDLEFEIDFQKNRCLNA